MLNIFILRKRKKASVKKVSPQSKKLRAAARAIVLERVEYFNQHYQLQYGRIFIKDQKTRWGSCSSKGNLNFNYRIAMLPKELQDYLVVHELCHLQEMNHGPNFWKLMMEQIPNAKALNKELKSYSFK
ncbi:MAG: putative metal-dependent hydrolase [Candidatus Nomurabacteria bacterium]|nr:putative metal-dependent hydrolase [Candidatus Nomurabacteria bacterium]